MKHKISAGGVVSTMLNEKLHVLFITFRGGLLSFPKGHTEENETLEQTAVREMKEEIGLKSVEIVQKLGVITREGTEHDGSKSRKDIHLFLMKASGYTFDHEEDFVWIEFDRALELMHWEEEKQFLLDHKDPIHQHLSLYFADIDQESKWEARHASRSQGIRENHFVQLANDYIKDKDRIVQIGVSDGSDTLFLAQVKHADVYGIDISQTALQRVQKQFQEKNSENQFHSTHRSAHNILISDIPEDIDIGIFRFSLNISDTKVFFLINEILKRMKVGGHIIIEGYTKNDHTMQQCVEVGPHMVQDTSEILFRVWDEAYIKQFLEEKLKLTLLRQEKKAAPDHANRSYRFFRSRRSMSIETRKKTLVLEALPASGKTSIADYLRDHFSFTKVNESLGELAGVNLTTDQSVIFRETVQKYSLAKDSERHAIIDRGYPSMLAWDYCAEKLGLAHDLAEKEQWVKEALEKGDLFEPDLYVFLRSTPELSLARRPRNETNIDVWSGVRGMQYYMEFCREFFAKPLFSEIVLSIDATLPVQTIAETIVRCIETV